MKEPKDTGALILVNDRIVFRRHADGLWWQLDNDPNTKVDWSFFEHKAAKVVALQQGEAGWVLREEWGFALRPGHQKIRVYGSKEEAVAEMEKATGQMFVGIDGSGFMTEPELLHRYFTDWLDPSDG
jgi:hypothetical protein